MTKINREQKPHNLSGHVSPSPSPLSELDTLIQEIAPSLLNHESNPPSLAGRLLPASSGDESDSGIDTDTESIAEELFDRDPEEIFGDEPEELKGALSFEESDPQVSQKKKPARAAPKASQPSVRDDKTIVKNRVLDAVEQFPALWSNPSSFVYEKGVGLRKARKFEWIFNLFLKVVHGRTPESIAKSALMEKVGDTPLLSQSTIDPFLAQLSKGIEQAKKSEEVKTMANVDSFFGDLVKKFLQP